MGRSLCPHNHHIPSQCFRVRLVLAYRHSNAFISGAGQARSLLCSRKSQADCCFTAQPHMGRGLCLHYHHMPLDCPRVRLSSHTGTQRPHRRFPHPVGPWLGDLGDPRFQGIHAESLALPAKRRRSSRLTPDLPAPDTCRPDRKVVNTAIRRTAVGCGVES